MNKSVFNAIIVIMCSALLGLIALQAYWINHDFQLKEQQFDQMVSSAMNQTVEKIDYAETYKLMSEVGLIKEDTIDLFHDTAIVNEIGIDDDLEFYEQQGTDYGKSKLSSGTGKQLVMEEIKDGKRIKRIIQEYDSTTFWPALSLRVNDKRIQSITHTEPVKS
ncbi:MAG: hypothetical protein IPO27_12325 [Bacteroidetes bacterium]|nr:hypothetical protein [Bacteroidota bacterium]